MKNSNIILLLFFVAIQSMVANNSAATTAVFCKLNPPTNLHVQNVGTQDATVAWSAAPGAAQYRIRTYDVNTGNQVHDITVSGSTTTAEVSWPDLSYGHQFTTKAWSIDANGVESASFAQVDFIGVILELVATGYSGNQNSSSPCHLTTRQYGNSCDLFQWGALETTYKVHYFDESGEKTFVFTIKGYQNGSAPTILLSYNSQEASPFYITLESGLFKIYASPSSLFAKLLPYKNLASTLPFGELYLFEPLYGSNYIEKLGEMYGGRLGGPTMRDRSSNESLTTFQASVSPNPFQDVLRLQINPSGAATTVHLYNLLGSVKRTYSLPADQTETTINTHDLSAGIYFLRIESGDNIQTFKVLKTQ